MTKTELLIYCTIVFTNLLLYKNVQTSSTFHTNIPDGLETTNIRRLLSVHTQFSSWCHHASMLLEQTNHASYWSAPTANAQMAIHIHRLQSIGLPLSIWSFPSISNCFKELQTFLFLSTICWIYLKSMIGRSEEFRSRFQLISHWNTPNRSFLCRLCFLLWMNVNTYKWLPRALLQVTILHLFNVALQIA